MLYEISPPPSNVADITVIYSRLSDIEGVLKGLDVVSFSLTCNQIPRYPASVISDQPLTAKENGAVDQSRFGLSATPLEPVVKVMRGEVGKPAGYNISLLGELGHVVESRFYRQLLSSPQVQQYDGGPLERCESASQHRSN